jgi:hypothetical protein
VSRGTTGYPPSAFIQGNERLQYDGMNATDAKSTQIDDQQQHCDDERAPTMSEFRALQDRFAEVEAENDRLRERVADLEQQTEQNTNAADYAHDRLNDSDNRLDAATNQRKNLFSRVHDLEKGHNTADTAVEPDTDTDDTASPLEQLTNLPEHVATEHLSANQQRARFVAKDFRDYADKTPKGLVLDSAAIARVLTVRDGDSPHTETVSRVMDFLDRFGKHETETKLHKGRRIAVFNPDAVQRYGTGQSGPSQCDVIGPRATG